jgi:chromosome segregation ATPase
MAKTLQTRIVLRYGTYSDWTNESFVDKGANLVLLPGEIGICEIPADKSNPKAVATTLFKVGGARYEDGSLKKFKDLPWASATAYDVNSWAKASDVVYDQTNKTITFVKGNRDGSDKTFTFNYVTEADVKAITTPLAAKLEAIESNLIGTSDINAKLGDGFDATNTVKKAIEAAASLGQQGVDNAAVVHASLAELTKSGGTIDKVIADIEQLQADLTAEVHARGDQDNDFETRIQDVEAFFETPEGESLDTDLNTLKKIQVYLKGNGEAPTDVIGRVAANEAAIKALQSTVASNGIIDKRIAATEASIEKNAADVSSLQALVSGYSGTGAIQTAINAVSTRAEKGIADADSALRAAQSAISTIDALTSVVNDKSTGLAKAYNLATAAAANVENLDSRITTNETKIGTLQSIVQTGNDSNTNLRAAITDIQTLVTHTSKGNEALYTELNRVTSLVESLDPGQSKALEIANNALAKVEAIEADYLREADSYILQCGTATPTN